MSFELDQIHPDLWRANQWGKQHSPCIPSGFAELDHHLPGGGWPTRNLIELLLKQQGIGELRLLMPVFRQISQQQKKLVLIGAPLLPLTPVFEQFGVLTNQITLVQTPKANDLLWAMEQVLQSDAFGALLMWLPEQQALCSASVLRRLQCQATRSTGLSFAFRPARAQGLPSPSPLRLGLTAHQPGYLKVQLLKRRGPVLEHPLLIDLPQPANALPNAPHPEEFSRALDRPQFSAAQHTAGNHITA